MSIRGVEGMQIYDLYLSIVGIFLWTIVSFIWKDRALILLNGVGLMFLINSIKPVSDFKYDLPDLKSRLDSFLFIGIDLPTDDLLNVIITKSFSDKQVELDPKVSDFIIKNVDRSYDKMFKFLKELDELSLSSGKPININLIKKVLKNEK